MWHPFPVLIVNMNVKKFKATLFISCIVCLLDELKQLIIEIQAPMMQLPLLPLTVLMHLQYVGAQSLWDLFVLHNLRF
jgi:hypothetical protein